MRRNFSIKNGKMPPKRGRPTKSAAVPDNPPKGAKKAKKSSSQTTSARTVAKTVAEKSVSNTSARPSGARQRKANEGTGQSNAIVYDHSEQGKVVDVSEGQEEGQASSQGTATSQVIDSNNIVSQQLLNVFEKLLN